MSVPVSATLLQRLRAAETDEDKTTVAHDALVFLAKGDVIPREFRHARLGGITAPQGGKSYINTRTDGFHLKAAWTTHFNCSGVNKEYKCTSIVSMLVPALEVSEEIRGPDGEAYERLYILLREEAQGVSSTNAKRREMTSASGDGEIPGRSESNVDCAEQPNSSGAKQPNSSGAKQPTKKLRPHGARPTTALLCARRHEGPVGRRRSGQSSVMVKGIAARKDLQN